jgi:hypothetical protein
LLIVVMLSFIDQINLIFILTRQLITAYLEVMLYNKKKENAVKTV